MWLWFCRWWTKVFAVRVLGWGIPLGLFCCSLVFAFTNSERGKEVTPVTDWVNLNWISGYFFACAGILLAGFTTFTKHAKETQRAAASPTGNLVYLLTMLDQIVGEKVKRIHAVRSGTQNGTTVAEILSPKSQIDVIVMRIQAYFLGIFPEEHENGLQVAVTLAEMGPKGVVERILAYQPGYMHPLDPEDLKEPDICFNRAIEGGHKLIIVEDIAKEIKKKEKKRYYREIPGSSTNFGCCLCYPFSRVGRSPLVICVWLSHSKLLKRAESEKWRRILERFANRIVLESDLLLLLQTA